MILITFRQFDYFHPPPTTPLISLYDKALIHTLFVIVLIFLSEQNKHIQNNSSLLVDHSCC